MKNTTQYLFIISFLLLISCNSQPTTADSSSAPKTITTIDKETPPGFIHAVYFWLKKDNPELLKEFIEKGLPELAKVPSIKHVHWGPPAGTPRDVVDNSYDMSWIVTFENAADQDAYQIDPTHLKFVELYKSLFERVQVYDSTITNSK